MIPYFKSLLYAAVIVAAGWALGLTLFALTLALFGCASAPAPTDIGIDKQVTACVGDAHDYKMTPDGHHWYLDCVNASQSWDQENLKKNDKGCPTAIFVAPNGNLTQCQLIDDARPATPGDKVQYFKTQDAAAIYVVGKIYEKSHYYEYGGVILKAPQGYAVSLPQTQHHGMDVNFSEDPESYDFPIVATYHVHPCLKNAYSSLFSPPDLSSTRTTNHPGYVLDECTGAVHYWAPGDGYLDGDAMLKLGVNPIQLMMGVQLSPGKIVGKIVVDGIVIN